jgi:hypothetical protein
VSPLCTIRILDALDPRRVSAAQEKSLQLIPQKCRRRLGQPRFALHGAGAVDHGIGALFQAIAQ